MPHTIRSAGSDLLLLLSVAILLAALSPSPAAADPTLEGHWEGEIELPNGKLEVQINISHEDRQWIGDVSIPAWELRSARLENFVVKRTEVAFSIARISGEPTFRGELGEDGSTLAGTFSRGGESFPFRLASGLVPDGGACAPHSTRRARSRPAPRSPAFRTW